MLTTLNTRDVSIILTPTIHLKLYELSGGGIFLFRHACIFEEIRGII